MLPGKVSILKTQSIGKRGKHTASYRVAICGLLLAFVNLACAIGVLDQNDPLFNAPKSVILRTPTASLAFPTDRPEIIETVDPPLLGATALPTDIPTPVSLPVDTAPLLYYTQAGDTLPVVAVRFNVEAAEVSSPAGPIPETGLLTPNTLLIIPHMLVNTTSAVKIIPDSELVYSPSAVDFNVAEFVDQAGGHLSNYREWLGTTEWTSGAEIIHRVALENSINPRLLLALLEYQSGWVYGRPSNPLQEDYPMGKVDLSMKGLYPQLAWAVNQLSIGYYGWREGWVTEIKFSDDVTARLAPD
ncbi:MAG TPA: hypothetical protein VF831_07960, partial [Anaerolineales bacterium]